MASKNAGKEGVTSDPVHNIGVDIGTMNLVCAAIGQSQSSQVELSSLRNVFLPVDHMDIGTMDLSSVSHTTIDNRVFILSNDAYNLANIFGNTVVRTMRDGMLCSEDIDSAEILAVMIRELIHKEGATPGRCVYSVPASPVQGDANVYYHQSVLKKIITKLGYVAEPLNEAVAIIYAECASSQFSGISISFGAGLTNVAVVYKSIPAHVFSVKRGGDWIDENVAKALGSVSNRVTSIKENRLRANDGGALSKKENKIKEALEYYYTDLVANVVQILLSELEKRELDLGLDFQQGIPLVISGGTALMPGFMEMVQENLHQTKWPLHISDIRFANDPLSSVAEGCLIKAMMR